MTRARARNTNAPRPAVHALGGGLAALFIVVGVAMLAYGGMTAVAVARVSWR
jgi:hypothetical protein